MSLDPNLVAAQWGLVSAFGIAVTLLAPKADQYRQDYLRTGNVHEGDRARQWGWLVRSTPVAVLIGVLVLSVLASPLPNGGAGIREDYSILAAPIVAQVGFIYLVMKLVPRLPKRRTAKLQDVEVPYPSSPGSGEDTVITVANDSDRGLTLWWINGSGTPDNRAVPMTAIPPGKEKKKSTKAWHYWLLRTEYGADVGIFQAADQPTVTEVGQERVDRAWREPREAALLPVPARLPASPPTMGDAVAVIDNKSDQPLNLCWLDRVGQPSHKPGVRPVPAGGRYVLWTRPGHYWLVRTADDTPVGLFKAGDAPTVTEASQRAVSAATGSSLTQGGQDPGSLSQIRDTLAGMDELPVLPGFREMALRRMAERRAGLVSGLVEQRVAAGLSQTEVAARMGTSQSAVARLESGATDARASTLERYAAAIGGEINWSLND